MCTHILLFLRLGWSDCEIVRLRANSGVALVVGVAVLELGVGSDPSGNTGHGAPRLCERSGWNPLSSFL